MYKLIYEISYIPNEMSVKVSDFMSKLDLGLEAIGVTEEFVITTKTKPTKKYLSGLEKILDESIKSLGGKVIKMKLKESYKTLNQLNKQQ